MIAPLIDVVALTREFQVTDRDPGFRSAMRSVVRRQYRTITAVDAITFAIRAGDVVGFLGPNGSGKTTTLKCLAGLLTPTAGTVRVLGFTPSRRETDFLRQLGFVMGQRWQLHPDLPVMESFELHRVVYDLASASFRTSRDELIELLDLGDIARQTARKLSLGQRMRCEFAAALLHRPSVVLLDEPTLGLDFEAQLQIRAFVTDYVALTGAAILLTSHYLADIEALSQTVMTISHGRITFTGSLAELKAMAGDQKRISATLCRPIPLERVADLAEISELSDTAVVLQVPRSVAGEVIAVLGSMDGVVDVSLTDPPLEDTLRALYGSRPAPSGDPRGALRASP